MVGAILAGLIVGAAGHFVMPGNRTDGMLATILLGIGGALVADWLGLTMGLYTVSAGTSLLASITGAMVLLFIYRWVILHKRQWST